jgi:adenosylcobinamide-GDP ribazoletransferase
VSALVAAAVLAACAIWFARRLGGYTGDCVGATQQVVELALLLVPLAAA